MSTYQKKIMPTKTVKINGFSLEVQPCKSCFMATKTNGKSCASKGSLYYPKMVELQGFFYAQCSNPLCQAYHQHEFLGISAKSSYTVWNNRMMPPKESIFDE